MAFSLLSTFGLGLGILNPSEDFVGDIQPPHSDAEPDMRFIASVEVGAAGNQ